jgi:hypothetical protein
MVAGGSLEPGCAEIFRTDGTEANPRGEPLRLHLHQQQAIDVAGAGQSFVVTTARIGSRSASSSPS